MSYDSMQDFLRNLADIPDLPADKQGEWRHQVSSRWIDGIGHGGERQDPNLIVEISRIANNEPQFDDAILDYQVRLRSSDDTLTMPPVSAIILGRHLIEAGAFAMRDLARSAWFLAAADGHDTEEAPK